MGPSQLEFRHRIFDLGFLQPIGQEATDLYLLDLATDSIRRLTTDGDDGWITPEFTWDRTNKFLMWTENRFPDGLRYPFPPDATIWTEQLGALLQNPPPPPVDVSPNGVGVVPLPIEQRTRITTFHIGS